MLQPAPGRVAQDNTNSHGEGTHQQAFILPVGGLSESSLNPSIERPGRQAPLIGCGVLGRVLLVPVVASQEEHAAGRRAPSMSKHVRAGVGQEDTLTSEREGG